MYILNQQQIQKLYTEVRIVMFHGESSWIVWSCILNL